MSEHHDPQASAVIAAELVACTLGQRHQVELRTDLTGVLARFVQGMSRVVRDHAVTLTKLRDQGLIP